MATLAVFGLSAAKSLWAFLLGALQGKLSARLLPGACQTRSEPHCKPRSPKQRRGLQAVLNKFGEDIWLGLPERAQQGWGRAPKDSVWELIPGVGKAAG